MGRGPSHRRCWLWRWRWLVVILLYAAASSSILFGLDWTNPFTTASGPKRPARPVLNESDVVAVVVVPDTLDEVYASMMKPMMPDEASGGYVVPDDAAMLDFGLVVFEMMKGDIPCRKIGLRSLARKYRIGTFTDRRNRRTYCILATASILHPWGNVIVDTDPDTAKTLSFVVPHPKHDLDTGEQGIRLLVGTTSRVWLVAGSHRRAALSVKEEDTTMDIGRSCRYHQSKRHYPTSDAAHSLSCFQSAVAAIHRYYTSVMHQDYTSIQLHGMANTSCGSVDTFMTHGSCSAPWSTDGDLVGSTHGVGGGGDGGRRVEKITILKQVALDHINDSGIHTIAGDGCALCGATNIQGRLINGVAPTEVCDTFAPSYNMQFIHIEQKLEYRAKGKEQFWNDVFNVAYPQFLVWHG